MSYGKEGMMSTKHMGSIMAVVVLLAGVGVVSAGVIRQEIEFEGRPVVVLLPENFDKGNDLIPLVLHLHGALPFENAPDMDWMPVGILACQASSES
jgi:hypothetical protein